MYKALKVFLGLLFLFQPSLVNAQEAARLQTEASRVASPPVLDGLLDDAAWATAQTIENFVQREPNEGEPVSERTEVKLLYDDEALYVGAWMYDADAASIVLGETRRDAPLRQTDAFVVVLNQLWLKVQ